MRNFSSGFFIFGFLILYNISALYGNCEYGKPDSCPKGQYCVFTNNPEQAECRKNYLGPNIEVMFPFHPNHKVKCWKSVDSNINSSHAWLNSRYAIDIFSNKGKRGEVFAGASGKIISNDSCLPNNPKCLNSFGNQIKILRNDGIMIYYAHLAKAFVSTGEYVYRGQLIAIEGKTGNVGDMWGKANDFVHLHMSVHFDWRTLAEKHLFAAYPALPSIPFSTKISSANNSEGINIDVRDFDCLKFNINAEFIRGYWN